MGARLRYVLCICFVTARVLCLGQVGGGQNAWPDVAISKRDYQGNIQATDRVYASLGQVHPAIEYPQNPAVSSVAYIRGSTINLVVRWRNDNPFPLSGTLTWQAARLVCPTNDPPLEYLPLTLNASPQPISLAAFGGEQEFQITLTGVPNYVAVGQFEIMFDLPLTDGETSANNGTNGGYVAWERVCLVDSSPTEFQVVPWVDFLEFTCRWAFGSVGQAQTMRELTKGFNKSNRCPFNRTRYSPSVSARYYIGGPLPYIWLTRFIDDITIDPPRTLDCRDYAAILLVAFESQGTSPTFRRLERWDHIFEYVPGGFYTWPLCPAGTDDTISGNRQENLGNYQSEPFAYHCVVGWSGQRYDAAASYLWNPNAQVWENPAFDWIELLHWQNPVGSNYYGLAYGLVAATYPFQYNQSLSWHYKDGVQPVYIN